MDKETIGKVEQEIGYTFKNKSLLEQAFTRKSYTEERRKGESNNEILEFFGDKVLDFIVIKEMADHYGELHDTGYFCASNEGELSEVKKQIVNSKSLSARIDDLGFAKYLIMSKGDEKNNAQDQTHVKEDLFEAILGAVAVDCRWDISKLQVSVDMMLHLDDIVSRDLNVHYDPVTLMQRWSLRKYGVLPEYKFIPQKNMPGRDIRPYYGENGRLDTKAYAHGDEDYKCILYLAGQEFVGYGFTKSEARYAAAAEGYDYLEEEGLVFLMEDDIEDCSEEHAVSNLQILSSKGYFKTPSYTFTETHDGNGNPIWKCECDIEGFEYSTWYEAASKKEAKRMAAYHMLANILRNQMGTIGKLEG
ncbi:MAG: putative dsRNA-binding protein [Clostridia bacterium]|nr:putative dsRNA-binding protein [Clostridia bacterium]